MSKIFKPINKELYKKNKYINIDTRQRTESRNKEQTISTDNWTNLAVLKKKPWALISFKHTWKTIVREDVYQWTC